MKKMILAISCLMISTMSFAYTTYYSDGTYSQTYGNTTYFSDGRYAMTF